MTTKKLGQFFTTNIELQKKVYEFIFNNPKIILEPSVGKGHLVNYVLTQSINNIELIQSKYGLYLYFPNLKTSIPSRNYNNFHSFTPSSKLD